MYKINDRTIFQNTQKQHMVRPQRLVSVNMEFSRWMPVVTAVAVGGYGCWVLGEDGGVGCRGPVGVIQ